jgi:hypothetical protein
MTIRFSRAEFWLLDIAIQECVPIADLISGDAAAGLNLRDHQCTPEELADGLERLFADRLISSYRHGGRHRRRFLTRPEIEVELRRPKLAPAPDDPLQLGDRHPDETYYRLTLAGGAAWEAFARPDWNYFVDGVGTTVGNENLCDPPYPCRGYAISPSRRIVEQYLSLARYIGHEVDHASIRWDIVSPWKATYWKTLPKAHRVRYKMIYRDVLTGRIGKGWPPLSTVVFSLSRLWRR